MNAQTAYPIICQENPACQINVDKSMCALPSDVSPRVRPGGVQDWALTETRKKAGVFETDLEWLRGDVLISRRDHESGL